MTMSSLSVAQRLVRSATPIQAVLSHRAMPATATVAALLLLCWTLAQGTWRMLQPASPAMARAGGADLTDLRELGRPEFLNQALIVPNPDGGFLVRQVQSGSLYEKLGLRPGDVIRNVNGQPLTSMDDVMRLYQQFGTAQRVLVDVQRQGRTETLYYDMR